jgi:1-acyl-sn-glycerol-3-phosphate acyltransferase
MPYAPTQRKPTPGIYVGSALRWTIGFLVFCFYVGLVLIASLFFSPFKLDPLLRVFTRHITKIAGIKVRVHGAEKLDPKQTYLFVFNHINMFDHFVIYSSMKHVMRGVEKEVHFKWPVYGWLIRLIGQVSIPPRGDTARAIQSLERAKEMMHSGISIGMAPEGTRSPNGQLQPFKKGAFHLAVSIHATIAPIVLRGMYEFNRKGSLLIFPGPVDLYFEDPIPTVGLEGKDIRELSDRVRSIILKRLEAA